MKEERVGMTSGGRGAVPRPGLLVAAVVACAVFAAACGSSGDDKGSGSSSSGGGKKSVDLAFVYARSDTNAMQEMALGAKDAASHMPGVKLSETAPNTVDGPKQVQLFQAAMRTAKDGIALETLTPNLFVRPLGEAAGKGTPLAAVDTAPPPGAKVGLFVGNSNTEVGELLAKEALKHIPEDAKGEVVLGNGLPGLAVLDQRDEGMKKVIEAERPGIKVLGPFNTQAEPTENYKAWNSIVAAHPNAIAYMGPADIDGVSLAKVEEKTGKKLLAGACDLDPTAIQAVKDGKLFALASPEHWLKGYVATALLAERAQSGKALPEGWFNTGALIVNADNVDDIAARQATPDSRAKWFAETAKKEVADPSSYLKPISEAN